MRFIKVLSGLALSFLLAADLGAGSLESELTRLESLRGRGKISSQQAERLGEIYFLTSRCNDVKALSKSLAKTDQGQKLLCACGSQVCPKDSVLGKTNMLRVLLERGSKWHDPKVQALWRQVKMYPESRYWVLKYLSHNPKTFKDPKIRLVRADLEKSLESLEVTPEQ